MGRAEKDPVEGKPATCHERFKSQFALRTELISLGSVRMFTANERVNVSLDGAGTVAASRRSTLSLLADATGSITLSIAGNKV